MCIRDSLTPGRFHFSVFAVFLVKPYEEFVVHSFVYMAAHYIVYMETNGVLFLLYDAVCDARIVRIEFKSYFFEVASKFPVP